jgi:hypothetical protein
MWLFYMPSVGRSTSQEIDISTFILVYAASGNVALLLLLLQQAGFM